MFDVLAKTLFITNLIEKMVQVYNFSFEEARDEVYETDLIKLINDENNGLIDHSVWYVLDLYERNIRKKK